MHLCIELDGATRGGLQDPAPSAAAPNASDAKIRFQVLISR